MNMALIIVAALIAGAVSAAVVHFLGRSHILAAMEQKGLHMICSECGLLVARFKQLDDHKIHCINCLRAAERRLKRGD